jgi:hypothetical protein
VVLKYLPLLRAIGVFFANSAIAQMCVIVSRPPHPGRLRGFDSPASGIAMPSPSGFRSNRRHDENEMS